MRTLFTLFALFTLLLTSLAFAADPPPAGFTQPRFVIGYWNTPPNDANLPTRFQEITDAHFNLIIAGNDAPSAKAELALCKKHDISAIFWNHSDPAVISDPAVWGAALCDEPGTPDRSFENVSKQYKDFKAQYPAKLGFINLYPNYATPEQLGAPNYEEHVSRYMTMFRPEVLCMDHYPQFQAKYDHREAYCANLAVMRAHSLKAGIPFWNFFNVMPFGPHTDPTEAQLLWQVNSSLCYGAKGVLYFCYFTPAGDPIFDRGGAILDANSRKTRHYEQARRINAQLQNLGPTLMKLTSQDVARVQGMEASGQPLANTPFKKLVNTNTPDTPMDLQIGSFTHADGRKAVLLQNYSFTHTAWLTVEFNADPSKVVEIDKSTGKPIPLYDESPTMPGLQLSLDASEARLFLITQ